jgi:predicted alpha/beta superfamily hydrolase
MNKRSFTKAGLWLIGVVAVSVGSTTLAAQPTTHFTDTSSMVTTHYAADGSKHELIVKLPDSYDATSADGTEYPVLYVLDGQWDYPLISSIYSKLRYDNTIPELIIVGLSYPGEDSDAFGRRRGYDHTPTALPFIPEGFSGGAPQYLDYLKATVVPYIESTYRADSADRALGGTSSGGLFTLWAMYQDPGFFQRYVALTPFIIYDQGVLLDIDEDYASAHADLEAKLFYAYGDSEHKTWRAAAELYLDKLRSHRYQNLDIEAQRAQNLGHAGVASVGYTHALQHIYRDIAPSGPNSQDMEMEIMEMMGFTDGLFDHKVDWYLPKGKAPSHARDKRHN